MDLINFFFIFDQVALGKQKQQRSYLANTSKDNQSNTLTYIFCRFISSWVFAKKLFTFFNILKANKDLCESHRFISSILLIQLYEQSNQKQLMNKTFQRACRELLEFKVASWRNSYELFQEIYFLLRLSFKIGRFDYSQHLKDKMWNYMDTITNNFDPIISTLMFNQLKAGKEYDLSLLYLDS